MKRPETITIPLTNEQFEALAGHFLWLDEENRASGKLGGILAQVYPDGMRVMALDHERAARLFAALGLPVPSDGARTAAEADEQIAKRREVARPRDDFLSQAPNEGDGAYRRAWP